MATFFCKDLDPSFIRITPSRHNRFLMVTFSLHGEVYTIVNIYMPTSDKEKSQFEVLEELSSLLEKEGNALVIVGGDFNLAMADALDCTGYTHSTIPKKTSVHRSCIF